MPVSQRKESVLRYSNLKKKAFFLLRHSAIDPMLREYFLWHLEDGLP
jgi:hypothetical protein